MRDVSWKEGNDNAFIPFGNIVNGGFGFTVATPVFMNGYDKLTDEMLFGDGGIQGVPSYVTGRLTNFFNAKSNFYNGIHQLFLPEQLEYLYVSGLFMEDVYYTDDQHKGIDIAKNDQNVNINIYSLFSGKVEHTGFTDSAGNTAVISYGFTFEESFYDTGIKAQFMHLSEKSNLAPNQFVDGSTLVGEMGDSGNSTGPHLHYQLMSQIDKRGATAKAFDMFNSRRDTFLNYADAPDTGSYTVSNYVEGKTSGLITTSTDNFWSTQYNRFHYNVNNILGRLGINVSK